MLEYLFGYMLEYILEVEKPEPVVELFDRPVFSLEDVYLVLMEYIGVSDR